MIDLRDTDKSRYFVITEVNNCFIIRSPSLFFGQRSDPPFSCKSDHKKEKSVVSFTLHLHMNRILLVPKHSRWALGQLKRRKICIEW